MRNSRGIRRLSGRLVFWLLPLAVGTLALLLSPREGEGEPPAEMEVREAGKLVEGRHYDWMALDSVVRLMDRIDPGQGLARRVSRADTFSLFLPDAGENSRAVRIFLNQRSPGDYLPRMSSETPFSIRPADDRHYGFHFPKNERDGTVMVPMLYDVLAGLLDEADQRKR
jgi:hypothetical protein